MRGVLVVAALLAAGLAGCGQPAPASLDDLLVRASDMPAGWRLLDFNGDVVTGDAAYPMATNPQAFTRTELQAVGWGSTDAARASAFVRGADPQRGILMFWAGRLQDADALREVVRSQCFTAADGVVVSGRNAAYVVSYSLDDLDVAAQALAAVDARTRGHNACPDQVATDLADAPEGGLGVPTELRLMPGGRAAFRFHLAGPTTLESDGAMRVALLDGGLRPVAGADGRWLGGHWSQDLPAGDYVLRLECLHQGDPPAPQSFTLAATA